MDDKIDGKLVGVGVVIADVVITCVVVVEVDVLMLDGVWCMV